MLVDGILLSIIWGYPILAVVRTLDRWSGSIGVRIYVRVCDVVAVGKQAYEREPTVVEWSRQALTVV